MYSRAFCATIQGIDGLIVHVEADVSDGLPMFEMVGLLGSEVKEAKERVRISLKNSGFLLPPKRITINLSPADVRKEGTAFDLPIAIAILTAFGYIPQSNIEKTLIIGELSLDGQLGRVNGVLPITYSAMKKGFERCIVPIENAREGAVVQGIDIIGVNNLIEAVQYLNNNQYLEPEYVDLEYVFREKISNEELDFADVNGQEAVKRAIEIAVSGMHNLMMIGPPGSGKTMLAKRIPSVMPELTLEESMAISKIYSVCGLLDNSNGLILKRPFRNTHHTITGTALVGGGSIPKPGEISLACGGVLFLDELPEFSNSTLELLRQPLEDKVVTINRLNASYTYPANFMLVAALNPCKCGFYPNRQICNCSSQQIKQYIGKLSRPLLDRIDICVETTKIQYNELAADYKGETSNTIRERIQRARNIQLERYAGKNIYFNSMLQALDIKKYCVLGNDEKKIIKQAFENMNLSARTYHRILKVARTIADLDEAECIQKKHLIEAIGYRSLDAKYWGEV